MRAARRIAWGVLAIATCLARPRETRACASVSMFNVGGSSGSLVMPEVPYLSNERALLIWDRDTETEHFVREVRFEAANQGFGFVVPVPFEPQIANVAKAPFATLESGLPFEVSMGFGIGRGLGHGSGTPAGLGGGGANDSQAAPPPLEVLSKQRVGKLTSFVLSVREAGALDKWLTDNRFTTTQESRGYLDHYVRMGFYFAAFRYEAPSEQEKTLTGMTSETVRISFKTPQPFYPYMEPTRSKPAYMRRMTLWFVSQDPMLPIAAATDAKGTSFKRPWKTGERYKPTLKLLRDAIGDELGALLPAVAEISVQTFQDRKTARNGFRDVLMVPEKPVVLDAAAIEKRRPLFALLDESLEPKPRPFAPEPAAVVASASVAPSVSVAAAPASSPAPTKPAENRCSIASLGPHDRSTYALAVSFGLLLVLVVRRRARGTLAVLGVVVTASFGCKRAAPTPAPPQPSASASVVASIMPSVSHANLATSADPARLARENSVVAILQGVAPSAIPTEANDPGTAWDVEPVWQAAPSKIEQVKEKSVTVVGTLPQEIVRRVVRQNMARLRACYRFGLAKDPKLKGTILARIVISGTGTVTSAAPSGGTIADAQVSACFANVFRGLTFPAPEGASQVIVTTTHELVPPPD